MFPQKGFRPVSEKFAFIFVQSPFHFFSLSTAKLWPKPEEYVCVFFLFVCFLFCFFVVVVGCLFVVVVFTVNIIVFNYSGLQVRR